MKILEVMVGTMFAALAGTSCGPAERPRRPHARDDIHASRTRETPKNGEEDAGGATPTGEATQATGESEDTEPDPDAFQTAADNPPDQLPDAPHLVLPGWEDLEVGKPPPSDAVDSCKLVKLRDFAYMTCRGCRSKDLPLPCVEIMISRSEPDKTETVSAVLPAGEQRAESVEVLLRKTWGVATRATRDPILDEDCWDGRYEYADLLTPYYDLDVAHPNRKSQRRKHPRRVVVITAQWAGGDACRSSGPASGR